MLSSTCLDFFDTRYLRRQCLSVHLKVTLSRLVRRRRAGSNSQQQRAKGKERRNEVASSRSSSSSSIIIFRQTTLHFDSIGIIYTSARNISHPDIRQEQPVKATYSTIPVVRGRSRKHDPKRTTYTTARRHKAWSGSIQLQLSCRAFSTPSAPTSTLPPLLAR